MTPLRGNRRASPSSRLSPKDTSPSPFAQTPGPEDPLASQTVVKSRALRLRKGIDAPAAHGNRPIVLTAIPPDEQPTTPLTLPHAPPVHDCLPHARLNALATRPARAYAPSRACARRHHRELTSRRPHAPVNSSAG